MANKNMVRPTLLLMVLAVAASAAFAQTPLLHVSAATQVAHGWCVLLTNNYTSAVTAYAVKTSDGAIKWDDSIPGDLSLRPPLPPRATASIFVPASPAKAPVVQNTAVIYADGATAGNPAIVAEFLHVRAFFLAELPQAIARMQAVAADPGAVRSDLAGEFRQQAQANLPALRNGTAGPARDRVSDDIAATIEDPRNLDLQATAGSLAVTLARWQRQLEQSLPRLQAGSPPP